MSSQPRTLFDRSLSLSYLGLPDEYNPSPEKDPISFLTKHITQLPPHLLLHFSYITSAKERTVLPVIRNRRLKYVSANPSTLNFESAKAQWPNLWPGAERLGSQEGADEKAWADRDFLRGSKRHVGKLGSLLGGYEEDREAHRLRTLQREWEATERFIPEEDESSGDEMVGPGEEESLEELKASFERLVREQLIYGLLEASHHFDYDTVDWDECLDEEDAREAEDRWFEDDDNDLE
ncbi:hypothetical protein H0H81_002645 [Sphagnurus paluster]|uniref:CCD97-like C-terminal domain-containing protein n=1 Tax=Sphagnurus paluster TaxID=117069 RepID=A0A9P7KJU5_9AGAR|nr:hypothetical protein H0H81_002645 [Sphagnurus paluster]